jgi:hypothetical protein
VHTQNHFRELFHSSHVECPYLKVENAQIQSRAFQGSPRNDLTGYYGTFGSSGDSQVQHSPIRALGSMTNDLPDYRTPTQTPRIKITSEDAVIGQDFVPAVDRMPQPASSGIQDAQAPQSRMSRPYSVQSSLSSEYTSSSGPQRPSFYFQKGGHAESSDSNVLWKRTQLEQRKLSTVDLPARSKIEAIAVNRLGGIAAEHSNEADGAYLFKAPRWELRTFKIDAVAARLNISRNQIQLQSQNS